MASSSGNLYAWGFAADADTERALHTGLAGHDVRIRRGRLEVALRVLAAEPASRLVFVDLDDHPQPEAAVRELTEVCAFGTALIAIGSTDSAHFVRALLRLGIADYLVKPISAALVREAGAAATDDLPRRPYAGRVIVLAGTSGSGTSTLIAAIARGVANDSHTVSVVDLDPLSGNLPILFDAVPRQDLPVLLDSLKSNEAADAETSINGDPLDIGVPVAPGISLIAYPCDRSYAADADACRSLRARGATRKPDPPGVGHRHLRSGRAVRNHAACGRARAALRADADKRQRNGAPHGAAGC